MGYFIYSTVWWRDLGWLPVPHPAALFLPLLHGTGEKRRWRSSWVTMGTGRSLTSYRHGQNKLPLGEN